jgi:hypothetical protein
VRAFREEKMMFARDARHRQYTANDTIHKEVAMTKVRFLIALLLLAFLVRGSAFSQTFIRPYLKAGFLVSAPNAVDLNYSAGTEQFFSIKKFNYGAGCQILFPLTRKTGDGFIPSLGVDVGGQHLFSSTYDLGKQGIPNITVDKWEESEVSGNVLAVLDLSHGKMPIDLQVGAGLYLVFYNGTYDFQGRYSSTSEERSSTGTDFGVMVSGGVKLPLAKGMSLPLLLRVDNIFRYGSMMSVCGVVGLCFSL